MSNAEQIVLTFPLKADHVSLARLTTSGVASQCHFDIDAIEDLKVCVSEILNKLISFEGNPENASARVAFHCSDTALTITIGTPGLRGEALFGSSEDILALSILHSLMDEVNLDGTDVDAVRLVKSFGEGLV